MKQVNLNLLFENLLKILQRLIGANISIIKCFDENLWDIDIDPHQIEQVIINISLNARDAMPEGGKIIYETSNESFSEPLLTSKNKNMITQPGEYVLLKISDSGTGMDDETFTHLFEPFFTTKTPDKGTGLGLSTAYGIIKQHNGYIIPYTEKGNGTTFKIYFPRSLKSNHSFQILNQNNSILPHINSHLFNNIDKLKVFLVEDEPLVRQLIKIVLNNAGYYVIEAESSEKCLKLFDTELISFITADQQDSNKQQIKFLLITDIMLPKMSGPELAKIVQEKVPNIKVLFISGYSEKMVLTNGFLSGEKQILSKPFTPNELLSKIEKICKS
jgi:CheY-like chemotaxis protein